jgi:hypothetical protein
VEQLSLLVQLASKGKMAAAREGTTRAVAVRPAEPACAARSERRLLLVQLQLVSEGKRLLLVKLLLMLPLLVKLPGHSCDCFSYNS